MRSSCCSTDNVQDFKLIVAAILSLAARSPPELPSSPDFIWRLPRAPALDLNLGSPGEEPTAVDLKSLPRVTLGPE